MARKKRTKRKSSTGLFGAIVIEALAVIVFVFLFVQARAERQLEADATDRRLPALSNWFEQTPFLDFMVHNPSESSLFDWN